MQQSNWWIYIRVFFLDAGYQGYLELGMYCSINVVVAEWKAMNALMVPLHGHDTSGDSWVLPEVLWMPETRFVTRSLPQVHASLHYPQVPRICI